MAQLLSLILLFSSLYSLGRATPYIDFSLGLGRSSDVGNRPGSRIGNERSSAVSLSRRTSTFGSISRASEEDELLDVVLLATIDGKFHALNRTDGTVLWSMHKSFTADCAVGEEEKTLSPLIRTPHMLRPLEPEEDGMTEDDEIYIVEPQSGSIYVLPSHATHSTPISKLSFTVPQLVEMSPVTLPGKTFVGRKETSLIAIDLDTGVVKGVVDTDRECLWEPVLGTQTDDDAANLDELEGDVKVQRKREVYVGRTDYTVQIRSRPTRPNDNGEDKKRRRKPRTQTLVYSSYGPNTIHKSLQDSYTNSLDGLYVQSLPGGEIIAFDVNKDPANPGKSGRETLRWGGRLDEPVVATFDVLYSSKPAFGPETETESRNPYILLQPVPDISQILEGYPLPSQREPVGYVGMVKDSLYVLGTEGYPLAAFGQSPRERKPPQLEGDTSENDNSQSNTKRPLKLRPSDDTVQGDDGQEVCSTLECLKGLRKWQDSTTPEPGLIEGPLEMDAPSSNESRQQSPGGGPGLVDLESSTNHSRGWWTSVFTTTWAIFAGAMALYLVRYGLMIPRPRGLSSTNFPELTVSPPVSVNRKKADQEEESEIIPQSVTLPSLLVPGPGELELAPVKEAVRVDAEGPEGGRANEPDVALVVMPPHPPSLPPTEGPEAEQESKAEKATASSRDDDWELTSPPHSPPLMLPTAEVVPNDLPVSLPSPVNLEGQVLEIPNEDTSQSSSNPIDEAELNHEPQVLVVSTSLSSPAPSAPSAPPAPSAPLQPPTPPQPLEPQIVHDVEPASELVPEEDPDLENDPESEVPQSESKKKKNRTRSRAKKKKAAFAREVEEREREKEREKAEKEKKITDRVIEKVVMEIEAEKRIEPVRPVSSLVVSEEVLGFGSHGTMVFKGSFQGRAVAVKRLLNDFVTLASREVTLLQESDAHPNVIRYYFQEARYNFLYIALELCPASLADIVERPDNPNYTEISCNFDKKKALNQVSSGLRWLHGLKIVHRDIKPQNILVAQPQPNRNSKGVHYRMLISDFGLCKKLGADETSFLPTVHGAMAAGTVGWRAPEILRGEVKIDDSSLGASDETSQSSRGSTGTLIDGASPGSRTRLTKSVDIFALGCLFYYTLSSGGHPFGDRYERESNIFKGSWDLSGLEAFGEEGMEAIDLISKMIADSSAARPDTTTVLLHPFFWNPGRRLTFLQDASDRFEIMCRDPREPPLLKLETNAMNVVGRDWHSRLDRIFIENLGKFRKYNGESVQDLMRALRNKKHHYQDLPDNVKRNLGPLPDGFLSYFTRRFPNLFLHVYYVVSACGLSQESMFKSYFELQES